MIACERHFVVPDVTFCHWSEMSQRLTTLTPMPSDYALSPEDAKKAATAALSILTRDGGQTASELARQIGVHKKSLNRVLYHDARFQEMKIETQAAPLWYLASSAPAGAKESTKKPRAERSATGDAELGIEPREIIDEFTHIFDAREYDPEVLAKFIKTSETPRPAPAAPLKDALNPFGLYEWQKEALAAWEKNLGRGIIDAVTGAGKTRLAVAAIASELDRGGEVLVLVPTIVLLHQWYEILNSFFPKTRIGRVGDGYDDTFLNSTIVIAVLASARNRHYPLSDSHGLLVADECHRAAAEKSQVALAKHFPRRLGLSATHERMDDAHETILLPYFERVVFTLGYQRAIDDGVISSVRVAFLGVRFNEEEQAKYIQLARTLSKMRRKLIVEHGCRERPFSAFLDDVIRLMSKGKRNDGIAAQRWMKAWGDKKDLLAETPAKLHAVSGLVPAIRDAERTLIFTQSIESANTISTELGKSGLAVAVHHSQVSSSERDRIMSGFEAGSISVLATVQTLEEGVDVPEADLAIIVASSKQRRQMIQRMGRIMRRKADGRDARFVIMYVEGTDEDPREGAHEAFVGELVAVARESTVVSVDEAAGLKEFLRPDRMD